MNNAFDAYSAALTALAEKYANTDTPFLSSHTDDLNVYDKDIILNDAQSGDHFLSILKANGCGTYLMRITKDNDIIPHRVKLQGDKSIYHVLSFTGVNQATVKQISYKEALKCTDNYREVANRVPRRVSYRETICQMLGLPEGAINGTHFSSNYNPEGGDKTLLKIIGSASSPVVTLEICRSEAKNPRKVGEVEHFNISAPFQKDNLLAMMNARSNHFLLTHKDVIYADFKAISDRVYKNAVERAGKPSIENAAVSDGLSMS